MSKDYSQAKIYKLVDPDGYYYHGSTCITLAKRLQKHKDKAVLYPDRKVYKHFLDIGWNNIKIVLVAEDFYVENEDQLRQFEDTFIEANLTDPKCLNELRAFRYPGMENFENKSEWRKASQKKYNEINREKILTQRKQYREKNKEQIKQRKSERIECVACKIMINKDTKARHNRSKTHLANMQKINLTL